MPASGTSETYHQIGETTLAVYRHRTVDHLARLIMNLVRYGFDEVVINVHHFADKIEDFLENNGYFGIDITYPVREEAPRPSIHWSTLSYAFLGQKVGTAT